MPIWGQEWHVLPLPRTRIIILLLKSKVVNVHRHRIAHKFHCNKLKDSVHYSVHLHPRQLPEGVNNFRRVSSSAFTLITWQLKRPGHLWESRLAAPIATTSSDHAVIWPLT